MTDQAPDDIFALYSRFDLNGDTYRVFAKPAAALPAPATLAVSDYAGGTVAVEEERSQAETISPPSVCAPTPVESFLPRYAVEIPEHIREGDSSQTALRNLWQHIRPQQQIRRVALNATSLAAASVSVYGAAGGVGTTTVAATLTRLLAKSGRRCAIFDQTGDSTLPIFFGSQRVAHDQRRFAALHSLLQPHIRILNSELFESIKAAPTAGPSFIERNFGALAGDLDHLVFDHAARCTDGVGAGLKLCIAIPDLSSLAGATKLMQYLDKESRLVKAVCVLNRFNAASQFHQEVLGLYREAFGNVVTIRDSQLLPEALAEGGTIVDWAPDSPASIDLLNLFAVVHPLLNSAAQGYSTCP